jgi:hypothetical protein
MMEEEEEEETDPREEKKSGPTPPRPDSDSCFRSKEAKRCKTQQDPRNCNLIRFTVGSISPLLRSESRDKDL